MKKDKNLRTFQYSVQIYREYNDTVIWTHGVTQAHSYAEAAENITIDYSDKSIEDVRITEITEFIGELTIDFEQINKKWFERNETEIV